MAGGNVTVNGAVLSAQETSLNVKTAPNASPRTSSVIATMTVLINQTNGIAVS